MFFFFKPSDEDLRHLHEQRRRLIAMLKQIDGLLDSFNEPGAEKRKSEREKLEGEYSAFTLNPEGVLMHVSQEKKQPDPVLPESFEACHTLRAKILFVLSDRKERTSNEIYQRLSELEQNPDFPYHNKSVNVTLSHLRTLGTIKARKIGGKYTYFM